jgi:glycosyltransferase involved in cell wall biosynthesis
MGNPTGAGARAVRVAQFVQALTVGGAQKLAVQLANARAAAGCPSYLYVMTGPDVLLDEVEPGVNVRYLGFADVTVGSPFGFARTFAPRYLRITDRLARDRIDLIQTHLPGANYWGLVLAAARRCRVVATVHNNAEFDYGDGSAIQRSVWRRRAYRAILARCDATVAVSEPVRVSLLHDLQLVADPGPRLVVVTNGVPEPPPLTDAERAAVRERWGVPAHAPLVLAAGRLSDQKNFGALVDAAGILRGQASEPYTIIAGDGPQRAALQARAADLGLGERLQLPGNVTDLKSLMQAADLFALPSLWEGLPLVLLEAMACGLPTVGSDIAGIADVVSDGADGLLVPPDDPAALAAALHGLIEDDAERLAMGRRALDTIERCYRFERVADELDGLYRRIVGPEFA